MKSRERISAGGPRSPEAVGDAIRREMLAFLNEMYAVQLSGARQYGQELPDYSGARKRLDNWSGKAPDVAALHRALFEEGVPPSVLEAMSERLSSKVSRDIKPVSEADIKDAFFSEGLASEAHLECRDAGDAWLSELLRSQRSTKSFRIDVAHDVQSIAREAASQYGPDAAAVTRLMFMCGDPDAEGTQHMEEQVKRLRRIITARQAEASARRGDMSPEDNFFTQMRNFISVYADVTAKVLRDVQAPRTKEQIEKLAKKGLSRFFESDIFEVAAVESGKPLPNPFTAFRAMLLEHPETNPWIVEDCMDTPFNPKKFGLLISPDVPRGLVADSASFLNTYKAALLAQRINGLLATVQGSRKHQQRGSAFLASTEKKVAEAVAEVAGMNDEAEPVPEKLAERVEYLERFVEQHIIFSPDRESDDEKISPFSALLRIIDPVKIVKHDHLKQAFISMLPQIPGKKQDETEAMRKNTAITASSVKELLGMPGIGRPDRYLDIPLLGIEGEPSIRTLLIEHARKWFDEDILTKGPYAHLPRRAGEAHAEGPLFSPRDILELTPRQMEDLMKDFDTARGVNTASKRSWITRVCNRWATPDRYETILRYARRQAEIYYGTGGRSGKYGITFYPSASTAMNDVINRLFKKVTKDDYIMISNQEYSGMTEAFTNHGAGVEDIATNDRANRKAKSVDALYADMVRGISKRGQLPVAILLSSKTRFGDAVGVVDVRKKVRKKEGQEEKEVTTGQGTPNSYGLGDLIAKLKKAYPRVPVIVDGAQSVGRNDTGESLERLGCDIYVNSGGKALEVEPNVAMLAVRIAEDVPPPPVDTTSPEYDTLARFYLDEEPGDWLGPHSEEVRKNPVSKLSPGKGTVNTLSIAGLGMALQLQSSAIDSWKPRPSDDSRLQRERVGKHMQELTRYAIEKSERYAESLLTNPRFPRGEGITDAVLADPAILKQFGCQVVYPVHRKGVDYNGILTVTFPNIGFVSTGKKGIKGERSDVLKKELGKRGFSVEQCLKGRNGVRISFHYLHEPKHIDALFAAIEDVHIAFLENEIERAKAKGTGDAMASFSDLAAATPNVPDADWMED